ncbi:MAG: 3-hydroxyacyl-CoA dehydrogenase NAD-binding domain-containing protein [Actinomycetota bacterium]
MAELVTKFKVQYPVLPAGKIALMTMDNGEDYNKPTTLSAAALVSLNEAMDAIDAEPDVKAIVLTGKQFIFCVGFDLMTAEMVTDRSLAVMGGAAGHAAFSRLINAKVPTIAAINGPALGGGLEIALSCKYRTLSTTAAPIAFPECFLGLVPGWGGTQLAPKLIGPEKAIKLIIENPLSQNRMIKAKDAFEMGLADRMFAPMHFLDDSLAFVNDLLLGKEKVERAPVDWSVLDALVAKTKGWIDSRVHGAALAPYRALELVSLAKGASFEEGFKAEDEALGDLMMSRQFRAGVYSFDIAQRRAKRPVGVPDVPPAKVTKIGIIGAGLMASQFAHLFLSSLQVPVVMKDISQEILDKGLAYVKDQIGKSVAKGRVDEGKGRFLATLISGSLDYSAFADCDFIIEAVFENLELKKKIWAEVEAVAPETCIFATNTSSLSISAMAADLKHPGRVVGFHFFNPVAIMPLLEIIKGEKTSDLALSTAFAVAKKIRKSAVLVKDAPGFVVNRLLTLFMGAATVAVDQGASFKDADEALQSLGLPMTPFDLTALVGPAVAYHTAETLHAAFPERYKLSENMARWVESKKPSVYVVTDKGKEVDPEVAAFWKPAPGTPPTKEQILDSALTAIATEIKIMLDEGVVAEPQVIDQCMIMGAGWPFFLGGITMYLDQMGYSERLFGKKFH